MTNLIKVLVLATFCALASTTAVFAVEDMTAWKKAVAKKVAKNQRYPRSALAREIEGKAKIRLTVAADGAIKAHEVIEETGAAVLDREIPKLVKRLNPLPSLPAGQEELSFVLPLDWRLD
ncbi:MULTISPECIES: energy transducer TonB [Kordiimonas]|uniref:energy transducer TonB n=1 Tax=Kordiimonas TaxID=288021 RepID=UPI001FF225F2|nr:MULTISPECIES: TonB family protein [Kordiimonas]MCK0069954.1 energy transducer TonB [Kordiimonas laminariae]UTW59284.1 TonB family protein [Kordiimonas sp. SCSIO 12603]